MAVTSNYAHHRLPDGRRFEGWANGIAFDSALVNADGASFELFPVRGRHDRSAVAEAKRQLRNARDVVGFYETWWPEGADVPGPPEDATCGGDDKRTARTPPPTTPDVCTGSSGTAAGSC